MSLRAEQAGSGVGVSYSRSVEERLTLLVNASAGKHPIEDYRALFGVTFEAIVIAVAVVLNALLLVGIARSPRLQTPIFRLILSVAAADLLLAASATARVYDYFVLVGEWALGRAGCAILSFLDHLLPQVIGCQLLACCWERFYAVCRPTSHHCTSTRRIVVIILLIWIGNTGVCAALLVRTAVGRMLFTDGTVVATCVVTLNDGVIKLFDTATTMVFYILASVTSMLFLGVTVCKAMKASCDYVKDDFKNHVLRCIFIVTAVHILLWLPQRVIGLYNWHAGPGNAIGDAAILRIARQLTYVSSAVKPVVYATTSGRFRVALLRSLRCCKEKPSSGRGEPRYQLAASSSARTQESLAAVAAPSSSSAATAAEQASLTAATTENLDACCC